MKGQKLALLIAGVVLFLVGLVWILMAGGWWLNWLILVVGVVLFVLSFIGKEKAAPEAPAAAPAATPEAPVADSDQSGGAEEPKEEV